MKYNKFSRTRVLNISDVVDAFNHFVLAETLHKNKAPIHRNYT